jgi:membrane associated rhomboid family serine protease
MEGQHRFLASLLSSALGGAIAWFGYLKVLRFTASALFSPMLEPGLVHSMFVRVSVTALAVFAALSFLIAALSHLRWWMHWLAFVTGIVISIAMRFHPQGIELTIDVLLRTALVSAALSSAIAAYCSESPPWCSKRSGP